MTAIRLAIGNWFAGTGLPQDLVDLVQHQGAALGTDPSHRGISLLEWARPKRAWEVRLMRLAVSSLVSVALLALLVGAALANIPDPSQTTWDDCLGRSPKNSTAPAANQYVYSGVLRNAAGDPIANYPAANVAIEIKAPCANPIANLNPSGPSNANGVIVWDADALNQGGGSCQGAGVVEITVTGLQFDTLDDVRSPDQDGDGFVAVNDLQTWQVAFTSQTPIYQGDLDCDTVIGLTDLVRYQTHFVAP
jgi:hypothetical protein